MHKNIFSAFLFNESKAFVRIKPFNFSVQFLIPPKFELMHIIILLYEPESYASKYYKIKTAISHKMKQ